MSGYFKTLLFSLLLCLSVVTSAWADRIGVLVSEGDGSPSNQYVVGLTLPNGSVSIANNVGTVTLSGIFQGLDAELTALAGVTSAPNAIPYFTGSGTASVISSSANMISLLGSANYATARTNLGVAIGSDVEAWDAQLDDLADGTMDGNFSVGNGAVFTVDSGGVINIANGGSLTGLKQTAIAFDESVEPSTDTLTAAQCYRGVINSYGRAGAATLTLPTAAEGMSVIFIVGTQHNSAWKIQRAGTDTIYADVGAGLVTGKTYIQETNQDVGSSCSCFTFQTGATPDYDWKCGAVNGTWVTD